MYGYPTTSNIPASSHVVLANIAPYGVPKDSKYINHRIDHIEKNITFSDNYSYSCIIVGSTRRYKRVKAFLQNNYFSEIGSSLGYHGAMLFFYYRPINAASQQGKVLDNAPL